jgi:hypothetical protein
MSTSAGRTEVAEGSATYADNLSLSSAGLGWERMPRLPAKSKMIERLVTGVNHSLAWWASRTILSGGGTASAWHEARREAWRRPNLEAREPADRHSCPIRSRPSLVYLREACLTLSHRSAIRARRSIISDSAVRGIRVCFAVCNGLADAAENSSSHSRVSELDVVLVDNDVSLGPTMKN